MFQSYQWINVGGLEIIGAFTAWRGPEIWVSSLRRIAACGPDISICGLIKFRAESFCLQSWTGYMGQTLVFVWDGARGVGVYGGRGGVNFYCHEFLASVGKISFLGVRMGASKVLSCLACCDATCIYQFIINNQVSFHLWSKENLVKHQKVSKYFDHGWNASSWTNIYIWSV